MPRISSPRKIPKWPRKVCQKKKKLAFKTLEEKATHTAVRHFTSSRTANIEEKYMSKSQLEPSVEAGALILALEAGAGV